jgi:hypothetical protein
VDDGWRVIHWTCGAAAWWASYTVKPWSHQKPTCCQTSHRRRQQAGCRALLLLRVRDGEQLPSVGGRSPQLEAQVALAEEEAAAATARPAEGTASAGTP